MQNSIYKIKYLLFLSWDWEAWCLIVWGRNTPPSERNTAWNKGRKCFHCLGAPNNLIRPCFNYSMSCRYSVLTPHWPRGFLTGFYSKDQSGVNVMARGQDFGVRLTFVMGLIRTRRVIRLPGFNPSGKIADVLVHCESAIPHKCTSTAEALRTFGWPCCPFTSAFSPCTDRLSPNLMFFWPCIVKWLYINLLKPNDIYICIYIYRTAALTSRHYILNIYSRNIHSEYFKHAA